MVIKDDYSFLSSRAQELLRGAETYDVEFKESLSGLRSDDLIAFANSPRGGTILVGVREYKTAEGLQRGKVIGCPVGDAEKLSIINRAESCIPSVELSIFVENSGKHSFFRVEIPSGRDKPYCTGGGTYKIRGNARVNALTPARLLHLFMENESQEFLTRFRRATADLERDLAETDAKVTGALQGLFGNLLELQRVLENVFGSATTAQSLTDHATTLTADTQAMVVELNRRVARLEERLEQLLERCEVEIGGEERGRE
ncbi:MAG: helix-turn-helix domain-containing protein [Anaerolineales bacterium]